MPIIWRTKYEADISASLAPQAQDSWF